MLLPTVTLTQSGFGPPVPPPWRAQEALSMSLPPIFHLVILTQAYLVKSKEPSPNSYAYSSKQVGENFILQLYSPFHFPISKTRPKNLHKSISTAFPRPKYHWPSDKNRHVSSSPQDKQTGQTPLSASLPAKSGTSAWSNLLSIKSRHAGCSLHLSLSEKDTGKGNASLSLVSTFDKIRGRERAKDPFSSQHQSPPLGARGIESSLKLKNASTKQIVRGKPTQRHLLFSPHLLEPSLTYKSNSAGSIAASKF